MSNNEQGMMNDEVLIVDTEPSQPAPRSGEPFLGRSGQCQIPDSSRFAGLRRNDITLKTQHDFDLKGRNILHF